MPADDTANVGDDEVCYGCIDAVLVGTPCIHLKEIFGDAPRSEWKQIDGNYSQHGRMDELKLHATDLAFLGKLPSQLSSVLLPVLCRRDKLLRVRWEAYLTNWVSGEHDSSYWFVCNVDLKLVLYGGRYKAQSIGEYLAENQILLQDPPKATPGAVVCDPHKFIGIVGAGSQARMSDPAADTAGERQDQKRGDEDLVMVYGTSLDRSTFTEVLADAPNAETIHTAEARKPKRAGDDNQEEALGSSRQDLERLINNCTLAMTHCSQRAIVLGNRKVSANQKGRVQDRIESVKLHQGKLIACIQEYMSRKRSDAQNVNDLSLKNTGVRGEVAGLEDRNGPELDSRLLEQRQRKVVGENGDLEKEIGELKAKNITLEEENSLIEDLAIKLTAKIAKLEEQNSLLRDNDVKLKEHIAELHEQIKNHEAGHTTLAVEAGKCSREKVRALIES